MPRERPKPPPFESLDLERSLDRYLVWGLVFMLVLVAGFIAYRVREPTLRAEAAAAQTTSYRDIGTQLFATNCSECHGKGANGGSAPVLNAKEFLKSTSDIQIEAEQIIKMRDRVNRMIAKETGQTVERIVKDTQRNFWMSAEEAVDYGIVSRIINNTTEV